MKISTVALLILLIGSVVACQGPAESDFINVLSGKDRRPPVLLALEASGESTLKCTFDEVTWCDRNATYCEPHTILSIIDGSPSIIIELSSKVEPGTQTHLTLRAYDQRGNSMCLSAPCWGKNERLPAILINEFTTKGSGNNPDRVELLILQDGNLAGLTFLDGIGSLYDSEFTFPAVEVKQGQRAVLEYSDYNSSDNEKLYYRIDAPGLGSNNGILTLYDAPGGALIDALLYSNRTHDSDTAYGGFGTKKVHERALLLQESGAWRCFDPLGIRPEDGIDSTYSTATRSMCRKEESEDTNSKEDWYVVPTGKASFGEPNSALVFEP